MTAEVTVSIPVGADCMDLACEAVASVRAQTVPTFVVVVGDGTDPDMLRYHLRDCPPDRIIDLPTSYGRYFADAVTLRGCETQWWTCHDADDVRTRGHLRSLLRWGKGLDMVLGGYTWIEGGRRIQHPPRAVSSNGHLRLVTQQCAVLWRTQALRSLGGPHPGFRIAWDVTQVALGCRHLAYRKALIYGYHYHAREGSLTNSPATGMRSYQRRRAHAKRKRIWDDTAKMDVTATAYYIERDAGELWAEVGRFA